MSSSYEYKSALPNKLLQDDGTLTDITGKPIVGNVKAYDDKPALPNKFINPDGTYSTLNEIIASMIDVDIFVPVDVLPDVGEDNKIYLVPNGKGSFDEYFWNAITQDWDGIGTLDISNLATSDDVVQCLNSAKAYADTKLAEAKTYADEKLVEAKEYTDDELKKFAPLQAMDKFDTLVREGTTVELMESVQALNLPAGSMLLGLCKLTDIEDIAPGMKQEEIKIEVYNNNVLHGVMTSTTTAPYEWSIQYANEGDFWRSCTTVDMVQEMIDKAVQNALGGEY